MRQESRIADAEPATYEGRLFSCTAYSARKAFTGSMRIARRAGT